MHNLQELETFIKELPEKVEKAIDLTLQKSALYLESELSRIFKTEGRSHDVEWAPLKEAYLKQKIKQGYSEKKLHRTTTLAQSFTSRVENKSAIVGTPVKYAPFHEFGTKKMPARPFMEPVFESFLAKKMPAKLFRKALKEVFHV